MNDRDENGWDQYQRLVLSELQRLSTGMEKLADQMSRVHTQVALLKLKAGGWSILGGSIAVIAFILIQYLTKR